MYVYWKPGHKLPLYIFCIHSLQCIMPDIGALGHKQFKTTDYIGVLVASIGNTFTFFHTCPLWQRVQYICSSVKADLDPRVVQEIAGKLWMVLWDSSQVNLDTFCTMCEITPFPGQGWIMWLVELVMYFPLCFTVRVKGMLWSANDMEDHLNIWHEEDLQTHVSTQKLSYFFLYIYI